MVEIRVGLVSEESGAKRAVKKSFNTAEEARAGTEKLLAQAIGIGWWPTYVLRNGEQCMKKLGHRDYEITI